MDEICAKIENLTYELLNCIGEDPTREGLKRTPLRVGKAWEFFSQGYRANLDDIINEAIFDEDCSEMVVVRDIEFFSMCEHHMIPFFGRCHVGYLPNGKVIGLSKIPRIVDMFSRRLQVQERLTQQIANTLEEVLKPIGVGVVMEGRHLCMQMRGVEKQNSFATTSSMLGQFRKSVETRSEFLSIISKRRF
jgi:GTP cyclohydrolase I